jgi:hypothetical protein
LSVGGKDLHNRAESTIRVRRSIGEEGE